MKLFSLRCFLKFFGPFYFETEFLTHFLVSTATKTKQFCRFFTVLFRLTTVLNSRPKLFRSSKNCNRIECHCQLLIFVAAFSFSSLLLFSVNDFQCVWKLRHFYLVLRNTQSHTFDVCITCVLSRGRKYYCYCC